MPCFTESTIEQTALDWLEGLGYQIAFGPDLAFDGNTPERAMYQDVILVERFKRALASLCDLLLPESKRLDVRVVNIEEGL